MTTLLDRILIVAALLAMVQCSIRHADAHERSDCAWLANTAYTAVVMHQQHQLPRENYHVAWVDPESDFAMYGESVLDLAFQEEGPPKAFAEGVFAACVGVEA